MTDVKSNVGKKFGIGVVVLALAGAIGAGLIEGVKEAAKSTFRQTIFSIFIAKLDADPDGSQTKLVRESLRRSFDATDAQHRIEMREIGRVLREGTTGDIHLDQQKAEETGKDWLKQSGAHVLIWGKVASRDRALRIFFCRGKALWRRGGTTRTHLPSVSSSRRISAKT
jgi:hypothetical protein